MFAGMREKFFDTDMLFTLSLGLGLVQIIFALVLNIVNVSRRFDSNIRSERSDGS